MNKRQKKLEKKRKKRDVAKKKARAQAARRPDADTLLLAAAARSPFGPCTLSAGWDSDDEPELVSVVVTRKLPDERLVAGIALVDRTCLGIKNAYFMEPMTEEELDEVLEDIGAPHGGMVACEPLVAQSIVYHAIDYAKRLGFAPNKDFSEQLFGPRPAELMATPWHAEARPLYAAGPHDNLRKVLATLEAAVGADGYDFVDLVDEEGEEGESAEAEDQAEEGVIEAEEVPPQSGRP
jgi:hypothetical protein